MLTTAEIDAILSEVTYRPGWGFAAFDHEHEGQFVVIYAVVGDSYHPNRTVPLHIYSPLPPMSGEDELLRWLGWRLRIIEIHESREWLRYRGKVLHDPHGEDTPAMQEALGRAKVVACQKIPESTSSGEDRSQQ